MLKNTRFQPLKNACPYTYIPFERKRLTARVRVLKTHFALFVSVPLRVHFRVLSCCLSCPVVPVHATCFQCLHTSFQCIIHNVPALVYNRSSSAILHVSPSPTNSTLREKYTHEKKVLTYIPLCSSIVSEDS